MLQVGDERRMIAAHSGDAVLLVDAVAGLAAGAAVATTRC
jgi:hypothetical protein